jgi:hypothetical protein
MTGSESAQNTPAHTQFAERYQATLREVGQTGPLRFSEMNFEIIVRGTVDDPRGTVIPLGSLYKKCQRSSPEAVAALMREHAEKQRARCAAMVTLPELAQVRTKLLPMLVHTSYTSLRQLQLNSRGMKQDAPIGVPWCADMEIHFFWDIDDENFIPVNTQHLEHWQLDSTELRSIALENAAALPPAAFEAGERVLILGDKSRAVTAHVLDVKKRAHLSRYVLFPGSNVVMTLVDRDDVRILQKVAEHLRTTPFDAGDWGALSAEPLILGAQGWEPFKIPSSCEKEFANLRCRYQQLRYEAQQAYLSAYLARVGSELTAVPAEPQMQSNGRHVLRTTWPEGESVLLPEVQSVHFTTGQKIKQKPVRWDILMRFVSHLLVKEPYQPHRWRTVGFPEPLDFARMNAAS